MERENRESVRLHSGRVDTGVVGGKTSSQKIKARRTTKDTKKNPGELEGTEETEKARRRAQRDELRSSLGRVGADAVCGAVVAGAAPGAGGGGAAGDAEVLGAVGVFDADVDGA